MAMFYGGSIEILTGKTADGKRCEQQGCSAPARYNVYDKQMPIYACKRHLTVAVERDCKRLIER